MGYFEDSKQLITIECEYITQTPAAWCVAIEGEERWIPKSVSSYTEGDDEIEVQQWFLDKNDIEY